MIRDKIDFKYLDRCQSEVEQMVIRRIDEKGDGAYSGTHEAYGILAEEFKELLDAMHANDAESFRDELVDIAVACIIALASALPVDTSTDSVDVV